MVWVWVWTHRCARCARPPVPTTEPAAAVSWDVFRLFPLADGVAAVALTVFAPRNPVGPGDLERAHAPAERPAVEAPGPAFPATPGGQAVPSPISAASSKGSSTGTAPAPLEKPAP
ncbi:hypothetical protein GCM10010524_46150 [Streptomyces mexicanus]